MNVICVLLDTLRRDHIGRYGNEKMERFLLAACYDERDGDENAAGRTGHFENPISDGLADADVRYRTFLAAGIFDLHFVPEIFCEGRLQRGG